MKKLQEKLKNTPTDVKSLQVCSSVNSALNKDQSLSVQSKVLSCNSPMEFNPTYRGLKVNVYVLSKDGHPLMPCSATKAKHLLQEKKAKIVKRFPFTIKLMFECENNVQPITLGVDPGFQNVGLSAITDKKELFSATIKLRTNIKDLLTERRMYRRNRRNRLRYRPARFNNRKGFDLAPSIQHKLVSHINLVRRVQKFLPITKIVLEVANFDIQKIKNPDIEGKEYSEGEKLGFWNTREYVLHRDSHTCQKCLKKDLILNVHHLVQRKEGGTNRPSNLITLCEKCHSDYHKGKFKLEVKVRSFKPETFMSSISWRLFNKLREILPTYITFGWKTKYDRIRNNITKSHNNDAFVIANGTTQERVNDYIIEQKRRHNRAIQTNRNGFKPSIKTHVYKIQPKDLIWIKNKIFTVVGIQNKGAYIKVKNSAKVLTTKQIEKIYNFGGLVWST